MHCDIVPVTLYRYNHHDAEIDIGQRRRVCHVPSSTLYHSLMLKYHNSQCYCISGESRLQIQFADI